jgi:hypothetical protein
VDTDHRFGSPAVRALLVRVAADSSAGGGGWNGPVDSATGEFAYVPIPENRIVRAGTETPYCEFASVVEALGVGLPEGLRWRNAHLDPDFRYLSYGDRRERAKQIREKIGPDDLLVFYGSFRDTRGAGLVYGLIGLYVVERWAFASDVPADERERNAHTRRDPIGETDIVVFARPGVSGRLTRFIPIGSYRERAYRVYPELLEAWGGLGVRNGYITLSGRLPEFLEPTKFLAWFERERETLIERNN